MRLILKDHNKTAYKRVMAAFEKDRMTCVCHPTGTGKSYIVAAVTEHFKRVLILAPNIFVLRQQQQVISWRKDIEYRSYQWLNNNVTDITEQYDLIVLDEFHRAGAPEWGSAVQLLIESQTDAKVLGTSATPIRYMDGERNMADELFDGHVASEMSIIDAWDQYILPIPRYVSGLFKWDKVITDAIERINSSRQLSDDEKRQRIFRLSNKKLDWELSYGMPKILRKHLDKDARRVIVFCSHIDTLEQMKSEVRRWFCEAGFTVAGSYTLHCNLKDTDKREQMRGFEADNDTGVKLMFCVDMLNEGIHVPRVSAVLMLRTTSSHIIYMQQMGRCLTTANTEKPLVLDMVDNITTTTAIRGLQEEFNLLDKLHAKKEKREPRKFEVIDYTLGVKKLIDKLAPINHKYKRILTFEEHLNIVKEYCELHGHLPLRGKNEAVASWAWLRKHHGDSDEVKELRKRYGKMKDVEDFRKIYIAYILQHHKVPSMVSKDPEERHIGQQWAYFRAELINDTEIRQLRSQFSVKQRKLTERIERVVKFCEENGRGTKKEDGYIHKEWCALNYGTLKDDPRIVEIRNKYQKKTLRRDDNSIYMRLKPVFNFLIDQQRPPRVSGAWVTEEETRIYHQLYDLQRRGANHPIEQKLLDLLERVNNKEKVNLEL